MSDHQAAVEFLRDLGCPECGGDLREEPRDDGYLYCAGGRTEDGEPCEGCVSVDDRVEAIEESERDGWGD